MAGTVQEWALPEVESALVHAADGGGSMTIAALREGVGIGHDDLRATLDALREQGKAVEEAPDEWRAPFEDEVTPAVAVAEGAVEPDEAPRRQREFEAAQERATRAAQIAESPGFTVEAVETRLTQSQVSQLDEQAIGALVKAGLEDGKPFVLRVAP